MMTEPFGQRQLDGAAIGATASAAQAFADRRDRVVGTKGANEAIDIEFDGVGAYVADGQEGVSVPDVGESGGHGGLCRYV